MENNLLKNLDDFFKICDNQNIRLPATMCCIYTRKVKWWCRTIDESGYHLDPRNIEAVQNMDIPTNAAELPQFMHRIYRRQWIGSAIQYAHRRAELVSEILEKEYKQAGWGEESTPKHVPPRKLSRGTTHNAALTSKQNSLCQVVKLAFPKDDHATCGYTNASENF